MTVTTITTGGEIALTFPTGLVGLGTYTAWTLRAVDGGFIEIVATDEPAIGFIVVPVESISAEAAEKIRTIGAMAEGEIAIAMLAVHDDTVTANIAGPIVIGDSLAGRQLIIEDEALPLRYPVTLP
jgi:flagellar assembly factor FliW